MPELPEVETMAIDLRPVLVAGRIADVWLTHPTQLRFPDPAAFVAGLVGRTVVSVGRRAKSVLITLDDERVLVIAPIMTGHLEVVQAELPHGKHDRLGVTLADGRELRLTDTRRFARFGLFAAADGLPLAPDDRPLFAAIGPEPWSVELDDFASKLRTPRFRRKAIKAALLDQGLLAGVGNIYADEALWSARLHPLTPAGSLSEAAATGLLEAVRKILAEGIARRGSSVRDYTPPGGGAAMQEHLMAYGRAGLPCRRCGTALARGIVAGRGTVWCPICQAGPDSD